MYHKITLLGNLGGDPTAHEGRDGKTFTTFSMATSERWNDRDGNPQERTIWWKIIVNGAQAAPCAEYLAKGRTVLVEGTLAADDKGNPRLWTDKAGNARASFEVRAITVKFVGGKKDKGGDTDAPLPAASSDDTLPF